MTTLLAVAGSLRAGSFTRRALEIASEGVRQAGGELNTLDLAEPRIPLFDDSGSADPAAARLKSLVRGCDALLVATPVYHDSYSGVLKNAIDYLYDELADKVVALISVGGGKTGHGQALEHLRAVFREAGSWTLPRQVMIGNAKDAFDAAGRPTDPEVQSRLILLGKELVLRTRMLRPKKVPVGTGRAG